MNHLPAHLEGALVDASSAARRLFESELRQTTSLAGFSKPPGIIRRVEDAPVARGVPCPYCHGLGHHLDGRSVWHGDGTSEHTPPTPCSFCRGMGRVKVMPLDDEPAEKGGA